MATQFPIDCLQASLGAARMLACPSRLVRGNEAELLAAVLPMVRSTGVILDISAVTTIDAAGVGLLATLRQVAERSGTSLFLVNPSRRTREILTLLGLDSVLLCKSA